MKDRIRLVMFLYHLTPAQVLRLTPAQLRLLLVTS